MDIVHKVKNIAVMYDGELTSYLIISEECLPKGWHKTFFDYCEKVLRVFEDAGVDFSEFVLTQVKEKFGAARIYFDVPSHLYEPIADLTDELENKTAKLCNCCGTPAHYRSKGWILPYCEDCAKAANQAVNERHKTNLSLSEGFTLL